jgi:hypothetical protein
MDSSDDYHSKFQESYSRLLLCRDELISNSNLPLCEIITHGRRICSRILIECDSLLYVINIQVFNTNANFFPISSLLYLIVEDLFVIDADIDNIINRFPSIFDRLMDKLNVRKRKTELKKCNLVINRYMKLVRVIERLRDKCETSGYMTDYSSKNLMKS